MAIEALALIVALVSLFVAVAVVIWAIRRTPTSSTLGGVPDLDVLVNEAALKTLKQASEHLVGHADLSLGKTLQPVTDMLTQLEDRVGKLRESHDAANASSTNLKTTVEDLQDKTLRLSESLRSSTYRGSWGENQLRNVIELAHMTENCDFRVQSSGEGSGRGIPDVSVRLPGGARIAIDAKAPYAAHTRAQEALAAGKQDKVDLELLAHAKALKDQVTELSRRNYAEEFGPGHVVLFVPGESLLADAARADPTLLSYAMEKEILLATPVTLLALLGAVFQGWKQVRRSENTQKIHEMGKELHQRMVTALRYIVNFRDALNKTVEEFNKLVGSLDKRLFPQLRDFSDLTLESFEKMPHPDSIGEQVRVVWEDEMDDPNFASESGDDPD